MLNVVWTADIARQTGIPIALRGQPRLQTLLAFGEQRAAEASPGRRFPPRGPRTGGVVSPSRCPLRLEDVYMKTVSTLNLSCAHSVDDVEWILGAIRSGLLRMPADGALAGPCRNQK